MSHIGREGAPSETKKTVYAQKCAKPDISETALLITISKFRKHFSTQTTPPKPGENHLRNHFWPLKSGFLVIDTYTKELCKILLWANVNHRDSEKKSYRWFRKNCHIILHFFYFGVVLNDCCGQGKRPADYDDKSKTSYSQSRAEKLSWMGAAESKMWCWKLVHV